MSEIRLTIHLPGVPPYTVYVEREDTVNDWIQTILKDNMMTWNPQEFQVLKNNSKRVTLHTNFGDNGFSSGDELYIKENKKKGNVDVGAVPEARSFHQLGILLLDGSQSMSEEGNGGITLAELVNRSVREFLTGFKKSTQVNNFSIAVITFDTIARVRTPVTALSLINEMGNYDPYHGGGTFIGAALEEADKIATSFLSNPESATVPYDARIIVLSDGLCLYPDKTKVVADRLKQNNKIVICSSLFTKVEKESNVETAEAKAVLMDIASAQNLYTTTYEEKDLRQFFTASMSVNKRFSNG